MNKNEFNTKLDTELTATENALINFNIYHNPKYIDYYMKYHMGEYDWCYNFLIKNRHLLSIEHTQKDWVIHAKESIKAARMIYGTN